MAGRTLSLRVITPERIVLDARVNSVRLPGVDGSIGVLPRRMLVPDDRYGEARKLLQDAGLGQELSSDTP